MVLWEISQEGVRQLNRKQQRLLGCGFEVCSCVLNFIVIGQYTINIPEIFQVFAVFWVWQ